MGGQTDGWHLTTAIFIAWTTCPSSSRASAPVPCPVLSLRQDQAECPLAAAVEPAHWSQRECHDGNYFVHDVSGNLHLTTEGIGGGGGGGEGIGK